MTPKNFAVKPTVPELAEMFVPFPEISTEDLPEPQPEHDPRCDCKDCTERAENQQDDLEQAQIHDIEREP